MNEKRKDKDTGKRTTVRKNFCGQEALQKMFAY